MTTCHSAGRQKFKNFKRQNFDKRSKQTENMLQTKAEQNSDCKNPLKVI